MGTRLVSYNLMSGGEGRADPLAEVLNAQRADVIGVHEATDAGVLRRLAERLGMEFVVAACDGGAVALYTRGRIVDSQNVAVMHRSSMPILDARVRLVGGQELFFRVAHLTQRGESDRMAQRLRGSTPSAMLMSHDAPIGMRVVDGQLTPADRPVPAKTHAPVRQLDQILVRPDIRVIGTWIEQDRLAYYASDHLPAGVEIDVA